MSTLTTLSLVTILAPAIVAAQQNPKPGVIPSIREWKGGVGRLTLTQNVTIIIDRRDEAKLVRIANVLRADLDEIAKIHARIATGDHSKQGSIFLSLDCNDSTLKTEGYFYEANESVTIRGKSATGVFYGTRSILQMLQLDPRHNSIPKGLARDYPLYATRGFLLDVGRKFFDIDFLRKYAKFMSWYKMNDFQLHLNDNAPMRQNKDWKKVYSAFRLQSTVHPGLTAKDGFYSRREFEGLQKLANERGVNITPEIDAPAHALAFTQFKPELVSPKYPKDHLNLGLPETQTFLNSVWGEFIPWFTSPHVHIGADEYSSDKAAHADYKKYINQTAAFIKSRGKRVRMWGGLKVGGGAEGVDRDIVVNLWYPGYHDPKDAVKEGYNLINTQDGYLYIVPFAGYYYQFLNTQFLYSTWMPYTFDNESFDPSDPHILGGMFAVWNDKVGYPYSAEDVHELVQPAMPTLAEKLWSGQPKVRSYPAFQSDAKVLGDGPGVFIRKPQVIVQPGNLAAGKSAIASDGQNGNFGVQMMLDSRAASRWIANGKSPQHATIDLGTITEVGKVVIRWVPDAYASTYQVSVSVDGNQWKEVASTALGNGLTATHTFGPVRARFIRLDCEKPGARDKQYSVFEFEVYRK